MLYLLLGMGICIVLYIVAFAFVRAAARADAYRDHDAAPPRSVDATAAPAIASDAAASVPNQSGEASNGHARSNNTVL